MRETGSHLRWKNVHICITEDYFLPELLISKFWRNTDRERGRESETEREREGETDTDGEGRKGGRKGRREGGEGSWTEAEILYEGLSKQVGAPRTHYG